MFAEIHAAALDSCGKDRKKEEIQNNGELIVYPLEDNVLTRSSRQRDQHILADC